MVIQPSAETLRKRMLLSRTWAALVIAWSVIRTLIIWVALDDYGFNPWIYLSIDLVCATVDAFTTPRMVLRFIDERYKSAVIWGVVSLVAFVIPDIYIVVGTRRLPTTIIVILCAVIGTMLCIAVVSIFRKVRTGQTALYAETLAAQRSHG